MGGYLSLISSCPRRTSDVDFCTMDTAPDLQVEQEDRVKVDRVEWERVEVVQGEPPSSPSPSSTPPSSMSLQSSSPTTSPYLESQQDLELTLDWYMQIKDEINAMEKNEN